MIRTIFSAWSYRDPNLDRNLAKSSAVLLSVTSLIYFPANGSTAQKILQVPLRLYSKSTFFSLPGSIPDGGLTSSKI